MPSKKPDPFERARSFRPPDIAPPFERSAVAGDGQWTPIAAAGDVDGAPIMYKTMLHPHRLRKDVYVALAAMDLERVKVELAAGTKDPVTRTAPREKRSGLVPTKDQDRLIAIFNGGFQTPHGGWGSMIDGDVFVPAREGGCTIAILKNDAVIVGPWQELSGRVAEMRSFRQTPPCLVQNGEVHPDLIAHKNIARWAFSLEGKLEIRRTALGVDATGRILYFGLGDWIKPDELAFAMKLASVVGAAELDVNWFFGKFLFVTRRAPDAPLEISSTLVPQLEYGKGRYLRVPSTRDFFYVLRRPAAQ